VLAKGEQLSIELRMVRIFGGRVTYGKNSLIFNGLLAGRDTNCLISPGSGSPIGIASFQPCRNEREGQLNAANSLLVLNPKR
jgi:hypothetical protein